MSIGIEVRGTDLTMALQAEELTLQQLGTMGLWQFLHGQYPGKDGNHSRRADGMYLGQPQLNCSCHCAPTAAAQCHAFGPSLLWPLGGGRTLGKPPSCRELPRAHSGALSVDCAPSSFPTSSSSLYTRTAATCLFVWLLTSNYF